MNRDALDPITVEVTRSKLDGISNEMQSSLLRGAFSPIVKEGMDCSASLFDATGQTVAQSTSIPIHLATMIPALQAVLARYPIESMAPGDAYIMNDPYCGGTHLPDIALFMPVHVEGRVLAFTGTMVHHQDVGGMTPGSVPTNATEIYQEGLRIPPLKYVAGGVLNDTLDAIMRFNIRLSDIFIGDLNAQLAACTVGQRRLVELAQALGAGTILATFERLMDQSEAYTRAALSRLPTGSYSYVDWLDNDGVDFDKRIRIEVTVTVGEGRIHFDLSGSSDQVRGPFNCVPSGALAAAFFTVRAVTGAVIPTNAGCFRPITLNLREGSVVNPRHPAPVNSRTATIKRICGVMMGALAKSDPTRLPSPHCGISLALVFAGRKPDGAPFIVSELIAGGTGASPHSDGVDCMQTDGTNSMNLPVEALAIEAPIRVLRFHLNPDSGGAGKFRGGLGSIREYAFDGDNIRITYRGERHHTAARGVASGMDGSFTQAQLIRADGSTQTLRSKEIAVANKGDRLLIKLAGGAGYGSPLERDPTAVAQDVSNGKVGRAAAARIYGQAA